MRAGELERLSTERTFIHQGELQALDLCIVANRSLGRHAKSYECARIGVSLAQAQSDQRWACRFLIRCAEGLIGLLDFDGANTALGRANDVLRSSDGDHALSALLLVVTARSSAAQGRLGLAATLYQHAIEQLAERPTELIFLHQVALALGEVRLDRGDFDAFTCLRRAWAPVGTRETRLRWQLLRAMQLTDQGQIGSADSLLRRIIGLMPEGAAELRQAAAWLRLQVLLRLNRFSDIERAMADEDWDTRSVFARLVARRRARGAWVDVSPSAQGAIDAFGAWAPGETATTSARVAIDASSNRTSERARADFSRLYNEALELTDAGLHRDAQDLVAILSALEQLDSPLMEARLAGLTAIVARSVGDIETAVEKGYMATKGYQQLGMKLDELNASRELMRALSDFGDSGGGSSAMGPLAERQDALLEEIETSLRGANRVLFRLNKADLIDQRIARLLRTRGPLTEDTLATLRAVEAEGWGSARVHASSQRAKGVWDLFAVAESRLFLGTRREHAFEPGALPPDAAVLRYVVLPDRIEVFVLTRDSASVVQPRAQQGDSGRAELRREIGGFLDAVRRSNKWERSSPLPRAIAVRLGLPQIASALPDQVQRLFIVGDDIVDQTALAALTGENGLILGRYTAAFMPRLSVPSERAATLSHNRPVLGVAAAGSAAEPRYRPLPSASLDLCAIHAEGFPVIPLVGESASHARVLQALKTAEVVHFACHGRFVDSDPGKSGLLLHDGWLTLDEITRAGGIGARVVTLSACWSANAVTLPGRERLGLPSALLDLGASAVVASVLEVPDAASPELVRRWYRGLRDGNVGDALRVAAAGRSDAPCAWAGTTVWTRGV